MKKTPKFFLEHIIQATDEISAYVNGISQEDFIKDSMRYNATIRMITVIGEAISQLENSFKDSFPEIPWQQIKSMRNRLIHEYWQTDLEQVYISATQEAPELKSLITKILNSLPNSESTERNPQPSPGHQ